MWMMKRKGGLEEEEGSRSPLGAVADFTIGQHIDI
jgi:hypothetical protein